LIEQLRLLVKLQTVDKTAYELEQELGRIPTRLAELDQAEQALRSEQGLIQAELDQAAKIRKELERRAEELRARQRKAESRLMGAKTQKEYQAATAEIDEAKDSIKETDDLLIEAMERHEALAAKAGALGEKLAAAVAGAEDERANLAQRKAHLDGQLQQLQSQRKTMTCGVDAQLLSEYDFIRPRRQGVAVAPVSGGSCGVCHMNMPPQQYNELQRMDKIMRCSSCQRLVYWADSDQFNDL